MDRFSQPLSSEQKRKGRIVDEIEEYKKKLDREEIDERELERDSKESGNEDTE
jgi:hypothetical protein